MSSFIQPLESRTLLSASSAQIVADELKIVTDAKAARADVFHFAPILAADAKTIAADLKALLNATQNRTLAGKLKTDATQWFARLKADVLTIVRAGGADARKSVADGIAVFFNPGNTAARNRLSADLTHLEGITAGPISKLLGDAGSARTAILADLSAISSSNPTNTALTADVQHASTDTNAALQAATTDVQTLQGDVNLLIKDLG